MLPSIARWCFIRSYKTQLADPPGATKFDKAFTLKRAPYDSFYSVKATNVMGTGQTPANLFRRIVLVPRIISLGLPKKPAADRRTDEPGVVFLTAGR